MFSKRRSAWEPEGYDQEPDQDLDWSLEDEGSEWDRYLDWVPGDERAVPKFKFPVVLPVVFGLVIGLAIAAQSSHTTFMQQAFGHRPHDPRPVSTPSFHHHRGRPTPAPTTPAGNPAALDCTITVPENPLSARGLATPYQLGGGCSEANTNLQAFVQATILDPVTGAVAVYDPLVITAGTTPAAAPVVPTLPRDAVVDLLFGFNGNILTQVGTGDSLREGNCVNGLPSSPFGQVGYCNAGAFYRAANADIAAGKLKIPALGTGKDGLACPTTRDFTMTDQDQSDNVTALYLLTANGQTAQKNTANSARLTGATTVANGSDNALLGFFLDPALGCTPMTAPDLSNPGQTSTSQALDELAAAASQAAPIALTPVNDPMTMVNGAFSIQKTDLYREGVDQPLLPGNTDAKANAQAYCTNLLNIQTPRLELDKALTTAAPSPAAVLGNNLFTFLAARLAGSFTNLNCQNYGLTNPVTLTMDGNGVATAAVLNTAPQTATGFPVRAAMASASPSASPSATATVAPSASASATSSASASPSASVSPSPSPGG
jgi:hypothetical protein